MEYVSDKRYIPTVESLVQNVVDQLEIIKIKLAEEGDDKVGQVVFFSEQISNVFKEKKRYSPIMVMTSFLILMQSKKCYEALRANRILTLPHPKYLQNLTASLHVSPDKPLHNNHFLKVIAEKLTKETDRWVVLELDEIYVTETVEYRSGNLRGFAENSDGIIEAKTVQVFLISSLFASYEHVVHLSPVKSMAGQELVDMTKFVIRLLESCGFKVLCVISDNNRINQNMFTILRQNSTNANTAYMPPDFYHVRYGPHT